MSNIQNTIREVVETNRVVIFMKGTKDRPQDGFSTRTVEIFKRRNIEFKDVDILNDWELRQGIEEYAGSPIFPKIYLDGKFAVEIDLLMEMDQSGELDKFLEGKTAQPTDG